MSRVARAEIKVPSSVTVTEQDGVCSVKGPKGALSQQFNRMVKIDISEGVIQVKPFQDSRQGWAHAGTVRAILNNMVLGVESGFTKELELVGVGYRAQSKGSTLELSLGFSHPISYDLPESVKAEVVSNTSIVLRSYDKQKLGQVAAEIRSFRPPEPYKGKGVRLKGERIVRKEAKKK